jgi:DNA-binding transcriptional MerR regulator
MAGGGAPWAVARRYHGGALAPEEHHVYRPEDVRTRLGISPTTLRRYAVDFEEWLSPSARPSLTESGQRGARRYTVEDLGILTAVKREYDAGRSTEDILALLRDGSLRPLDVVDNNPVRTHFPAPGAATVDSESAMVGVPALIGVDVEQFVGQLAAINAALPAIAQALEDAQRERAEAAAEAARQQAELAGIVERQAAALRAQQYQVEELRQEREALSQLRAELEAERAAEATNSPEVLVAPVTVGQRLKRLFTRES